VELPFPTPPAGVRARKCEGRVTGGGATGGNVTLGSAALTTGGDNTSPTPYAGTISGTGSVIKIGSGVQTFSGVNTYSGGTIISAGTLFANSATTSLGTGAVNLNGGMLAGNGTVGNSGAKLVTVNSGGTIGAGADANHTATLTTGKETWNAGGSFAVKINDTGNAISGNGTGSGAAGSAVGWDEISTGTLTLSGLSGSSSTFAVTLSSFGSNTPNTAVPDFSNAGNYLWQIGAITGAGITSSGTPAILAQTNATGANISADSNEFTLNTSNFVTANGSTGTFVLEAVDVGGKDQLSIGYDAAPEPGTATLALCAAAPMFMGRRRRRTKN
jgi:fibronectin-binding autotransporter adhesin